MPVIEISSLSHPGVEVFSTLTETQLRNRTEPDKGIFIVESPKVITRALDSGYEPLAILCEYKHIVGDAAEIIERCENVPVYTGSRECSKTDAHCRSSFDSIDNRCGCYSVFYHQVKAGIFKKITEGSI